jgi:hypothetical protein
MQAHQPAAVSSIRLKAGLHAIRLEAGPRFEEVVSKSDTVETPIATITGPLPVIKATREVVVQLATTNPSILNFTSERQRRYLLGCRETFLGSTYRLPDGVYEVDDVYYHPQDVSRVLGHLHMLYGVYS